MFMMIIKKNIITEKPQKGVIIIIIIIIIYLSLPADMQVSVVLFYLMLCFAFRL